MTNSNQEPTPGKRARLVAAARQLLHQQGVQKTTIADVAEVAGVPVGNVYYYFKTKDELVEAAIEAHTQDIQAMFASFERLSTPTARLKALVGAMVDQRDIAARYGCPHGSLCQELDKRDDGLDRIAAQLMALYIDWAEQQFRLMNRRDARELAVDLIARYQGALLLTNTFRDPDLATRQAHRLESWIDSLT